MGRAPATVGECLDMIYDAEDGDLLSVARFLALCHPSMHAHVAVSMLQRVARLRGAESQFLVEDVLQIIRAPVLAALGGLRQWNDLDDVLEGVDDDLVMDRESDETFEWGATAMDKDSARAILGGTVIRKV